MQMHVWREGERALVGGAPHPKLDHGEGACIIGAHRKKGGVCACIRINSSHTPPITEGFAAT